MERYFLPPHVHCCQSDSAFVFLDLKQDEYFLVSGEEARALGATDELCSPRTEIAPSETLRDLLNGGLITENPTRGRPFATTQSTFPLEILLGSEQRSPRIAFADYYNFTAACITATWRLRWCTLLSTVEHVARRKTRSSLSEFDFARAGHLTAVFQRLRRLFPTNYLCLFDSLALLEFLWRYDIHPTWVFGIKLDPWAAHCWIQQGQFTFNENVEGAAAYTPILSI